LNRPSGHQEHWVYSGFPGMSIRDYFAGQALTGIFAQPTTSVTSPEVAEGFATECYLMADAMLKAKVS
jgi:hypothetical protein